MVPAPVAPGIVPGRTAETPGAGGFELLPASAGASAAPSLAEADVVANSGRSVSATEPQPGPKALVADASGFQLVPAAAPRPPSIVTAEHTAVLAAPVVGAVDGFQLIGATTAPSYVQPVAAFTPAASAPQPAAVTELSSPVRVSLALADGVQLMAGVLSATRLNGPKPAPMLAAAAFVEAAPKPAQALAAPAPDAPVQALLARSIQVQALQTVADVPRLASPASLTEMTPTVFAQATEAVQARLTPAIEPTPPTIALSAPRLTAPVALATLTPAVFVQAPAISAPSQARFLRAAELLSFDAAPAAAHLSAPVPLACMTAATFVPAAPRAEHARLIPAVERVAFDSPAAASKLVAPALLQTSAVAYLVPAATPVQVAFGNAPDRVDPARRASPAIDGPVATAPSLELVSVAPERSLVAQAAGTAASAQAHAAPAAADVAASQPAKADQGVILLAQANTGPTPQPASSPSPAPAQAAPPAAAPAANVPAPASASTATATAPSAPPPAPPPPPVVGRILVQGNERIEPSTILSYLPIQPGDVVDSAKIDLAVKTLFRTDLFADVAIEMQGTDLIVKVSENPIINQVVFEGNHALKEDKLRDEVSVRPRGIFTRSKVEQDAQKIIELYRRSGRISATVTPKIVQLPQKRVDLIFEIDEGPKSGIVHINFVGNRSYSDGSLRDVIVTRESHWFKFFQSNDNYDPDRIEYDREQLRKFYRNHGFYDFRIVSAVAELAPDKNGFVVTFTVEEGPKYHFGKLLVTTQLKRLNGELLQALLPVRAGQLYEDDRIEKATDALTYAAGANGFAFVDVRPRYVAHPESRTVDVTFDIKEGPRVYIERIEVVGNTRTLDYVIRREMRVAEGDAYNRVLVDRSKNQIKALGFFKDVDIEQVPGSAPDKTVLRVKVTEQPTGQLTFSVGYSSLEKLVGDVGISESNFRGRGQKVDFEVSMGYLQKRVSLSFTEPRFQGRNMAAGFDLYTYNYNYSTTASFSSSSTGITLRTGFPINQYASIGLRYSIHSDKVSVPSYVIDPTTGRCTAGYSQSLCDEIGTTFTSSVGYTVRLDRRNDPIIPTRGFFIDFGQDFAGLGGVRYIRTTADGAWYYGIAPKWIASFQVTSGYITGWGGSVVRINDRFFEGGDTFRGFQIAGIGPRDTSIQTSCSSASSTSSTGTCYGDALGAKAYAIGTVELQVPNPIPAQYGIKTALFTDFGTAGLLDSQTKRNPDGTVNPFIRDNLAFRASAGVSVFWKSPMGPLRFDFSKVLKKAPYDVTETFRFSTTTQFQ